MIEIHSQMEEYSIEGLISELKRRVKHVNNSARSFLILIVSLLATGILIFFNDYGIDTKSLEEKRRDLESEVFGIDTEIEEYYYSISSTFKKIKGYWPDTTITYDSILNIFESNVLYSDSIGDIKENFIKNHPYTRRRVVDSLEFVYENMKEDLALVENKIKEFNLGIAEIDSNFLLSRKFVENTITRFGSLIIIFFLVRVLVVQYRYKLKLSAFYQGVVDSLILLNSEKFKEKISIESLFKILQPEINFTTEPEVPYDKLVDLAKSISAKGTQP